MRHGKARFVTGFLALPVALYVYYVMWPFAQTFGYSLTNWGGYSDTQEFVGLANYVTMFKDEVARKAFWHSVFFLVTLPLLTIALALFLAFMLNVGGRGNRAGIRGVWGSTVYKVIFFFPQVLSLVLVAIMWQAIYRGDSQGLLNGILIKIGLVDADSPNRFVADPEPFLGVPAVLWWLLLIAVWGGTGFYMVLFSAAMQSIPKDIYEAALLDGSGRLSTFRLVTLPLVWDTVQVGWVYLAIQAMDGFALVHIMLGIGGGPSRSGDVLGVMLYRELFNSKAGYASAIGVVLLVLTLIITVLFMRVARRERVEY